MSEIDEPHPVDFSSLVGWSIRGIDYTAGCRGAIERLVLHLSSENGEKRRNVVLGHDRQCCEDVSLDLECLQELRGLIGCHIIEHAEVTSNRSEEPGTLMQWTFYTLRSHAGTAVLRWVGVSNGFYSVDVQVWEGDS